MNRTVDAKTSDRKIVDPKVVFTASFLLGLLLLVILRTNVWRLPLPAWIVQSAASVPAGPEECRGCDCRVKS